MPYSTRCLYEGEKLAYQNGMFGYNLSFKGEYNVFGYRHIGYARKPTPSVSLIDDPYFKFFRQTIYE